MDGGIGMFTSGYLGRPNKVVFSVVSPAKGIRKKLIMEAVKAQDLEKDYQGFCLRGAQYLTWVGLRYEPLGQRMDADKRKEKNYKRRKSRKTNRTGPPSGPGSLSSLSTEVREVQVRAQPHNKAKKTLNEKRAERRAKKAQAGTN